VIGATLAVALSTALLGQSPPPPRDPRLRAASVERASISGTVTSDETEPRRLRRVLVTLNGPAVDLGGRTVITDDEGRFMFDALPPGQYGLIAHKEGYVPARYGSSLRAPRIVNPFTMGRTGLTVVRGETVTADIRMARGAVVTGVVTDADGRPEQGVLVGVSAYQFVPYATERRWLPAGSGTVTTDDRGVYRIYGLAAGEYIVSARRGGAPQPIKQSSTDARSVTAAPVFSPSTTDVADATRIRLAPGDERTGVDIQMRYVPTATVAGTAAVPAGSFGRVTLTRATGQPGSVDLVALTTLQADGAFTFPGVVPGRYTVYAVAEASPTGSSAAGSVDIDVDGEDLPDIVIPISSTVSLSGTFLFDGATSPAVHLGSMTLPIAPIGGGYLFARPYFQPVDDSHFTISHLIPGQYALIGANAPGIRTPMGKWWLKSIIVGGREALDGPVEIRQSTDDVVVTLGDQASTVSGSVRDAHGAPLPGVFVVVFAADRASWFFNSRRVAGIRSDPQGRYTIRNLPPGDYRATVALDLEQGEWFDADVLQSLLPTSVVVTIAGTDAKTLDLILR
jgi:protocatechuate 3,4-dioxygenase beta subunit